VDKLTLTSDVTDRLRTLGEPLEVCDTEGRTMGHLLPTEPYEDLFYSAMASVSPQAKEEPKRRHQEQGGRPLAEIWQNLGAS
jgi:hypothetical protein